MDPCVKTPGDGRISADLYDLPVAEINSTKNPAPS
jgi:hypothetical protein